MAEDIRLINALDNNQT